MKFKNEKEYTLQFDVNDWPFEVAPGDVCDIPDRFAYVVAKRGLPLSAVGEFPKPLIPKKKQSGHRTTIDVHSAPKGVVLEFSEDLSKIPLESEKL